MPRNSTIYGITGTTTFRLNAKKIFDEYGTNLQNPSADICRIHTADPGKILVQIDQSGAEALVVAWLCEHGNFRDLFLHGVKSHVFVALHAFKDQWEKRFPEIWNPKFISCKVGDLTKQDRWEQMDDKIKESDTWPALERYYYIAKTICHASNYGIEPYALQLNVLKKSEGTIVLTTRMAKKFLDLYHSLFPEIRRWHNTVRDELDTHGELRNLFGHPRVFSNYRGTPNDLKDALSFVPQSTVGCITHFAITRLQRFIETSPKPHWDILNNKHDSFLVQCPVQDLDECIKVGKEFMNQELTTPRGETFRMKSGCEVGYNWGHENKETNPDGLH